MSLSVKINGISKSYKRGISKKRIQAIDRLSLDISEGEVFGLVGPNGAGKSTTIKILMNFVFPDSGNATIFGQNVCCPEARKDIGFLPENPCYYKSLSAQELLSFGAETAGMSKVTAQLRIDDLLRLVRLDGFAKQPIRTYSKGMVQRVGIALALVHDPRLVILDEPMSGLDPIGRKLVGDIILDIKKQGRTVFLSSHILNDAERFCDRIGIIARGSLCRVESVANILNEFSSLESAFMKTVSEAGALVI